MIGHKPATPDAPMRAGGARILFLTPRFPYPPIKGDTLRVYHQLRHLSRDHAITLLSIADAPVSRADYEQVAALCERVEVVRMPPVRLTLGVPLPRGESARGVVRGLLRGEPLQVGFYQIAEVAARLHRLLQEGSFDAVHATLIRMLPYVWQRKETPVVVDLIDSLGLNLEARREQVRGPKRLLYEFEYGRVLAYERAVVRRFPHLVVSSPSDREALGGGSVEVIPNGVDLDLFSYQGEQGREPATLIFSGNMGYEPNEEAVLWLAAEVWPRLKARRPELRWQIAGARPTERVRALHRSEDGIEVTGPVPDLVGYLQRATVAVAPMRNGSGIQNKVLEALATGTPTVATSIGNRGTQARHERDLLLADNAADFAAAVEHLLDEPQTRERLRRAGRDFVEANFRWEEHARRLSEIYAAAAQPVS